MQHQIGSTRRTKALQKFNRLRHRKCPGHHLIARFLLGRMHRIEHPKRRAPFVMVVRRNFRLLHLETLGIHGVHLQGLVQCVESLNPCVAHFGQYGGKVHAIQALRVAVGHNPFHQQQGGLVHHVGLIDRVPHAHPAEFDVALFHLRLACQFKQQRFLHIGHHGRGVQFAVLGAFDGQMAKTTGHVTTQRGGDEHAVLVAVDPFGGNGAGFRVMKIAARFDDFYGGLRAIVVNEFADATVVRDKRFHGVFLFES